MAMYWDQAILTIQSSLFCYPWWKDCEEEEAITSSSLAEPHQAD